MSTYDARDLPRLALLLALLVSAGCSELAPHAPDAQEEPPVTILERLPLDAEAPVERDLVSREIHPYELPLDAGDYVQIAAEQQGADLALRLVESGSEKEIAHADRPTGRTGRERLRALVEESGTYRLEVRSLDDPPHTGRYRLWLEARRPATEDDRRRVAADRSFYQGEDLLRQQKPAEALPHYQQALDGWTATGETGERATTLYRLGVIALSQQGKRSQAQALEYFEEARQIFEQEDNQLELASLLTQLAWLQWKLDRFEGSLASYRHAAETFARLGDLAGEATAYHGLGTVCSQLDQTEEAMRSYERAVELWRQADRPKEMATSHEGLGRLYLDRHELPAAQHHYGRARELAREIGETGQERRCRSVLAEILRRRGDPSAARSELEAVLGEMDDTGEPQERFDLLSKLGTVALDMRDIETARARFEEALALARRHELRRHEAAALHKLGRVAFVEGDFTTAHRYHVQAGQIFTDEQDRQGVLSARYGEARALYRLGELEAAESLLAEILGGAEELRAESDSLDLRARYLARRHHYWDLYVEILMALHERRPDSGFDLRALEISERARARSLVDLLHEARLRARSQAEPQLLAEEREIEGKLAALERQRHAALRPGDGGGTEEVLREIEEQRRALQLALDRVQRQIRGSSLPEGDLAPFTVTSIADVRRWVLHRNTALLVYHLGEDRSFAWRIAHDRITASEVLPARVQVEQGADRFLQALRDVHPQARQERQSAGRALAEMLLPPRLLEGKQDRLVVVPDGRLHVLPFAALPLAEAADPEKPEELLLDRHEVVQVPSMAVLVELRRRAASPRPIDERVVVLADPVFAGDDERLRGASGQSQVPEVAPPDQLRSVGLERLERLPFTGEEARAIGRHCEQKGSEALLLTGFDATKDRLSSDEIRRARVIHFATHGIVDPQAPERSALILSMVDAEGRALPGLLPLDEIYGLELAADLVVLSACRTGLGEEVLGEGVIGLSRGFFYAGAPRVIHTLWSVDDESTSELMGLFYQHYLGNEMAPSQALRQAQRELRSRPGREAPFHWAAFVFQGDWLATGIRKADPDDPIGGTMLGPVEPPPDPEDDDIPIKLPPLPRLPATPGTGGVR